MSYTIWLNTSKDQHLDQASQTALPATIQPLPAAPTSQQPLETNTKKIIETDTVPLAFETITESDKSLKVGESKIKVAGKNGEKTITYEVIYKNGVETNRKKIAEEITLTPVTEIIVKGGPKQSQSRQSQTSTQTRQSTDSTTNAEECSDDLFLGLIDLRNLRLGCD